MKKINWKRELQLILVYVCIIVVVRYTFFPFHKLDGQIRPLNFSVTKIIPFKINLKPFVHMWDYADKKEAILNLVGNITMFIPLGIIFPIVYKNLNNHAKVIAVGIGFSVVIEILQLLCFERTTDIDDLIMNSSGYIIGYIIYLIVKCIKSKLLRSQKRVCN
ncbi:MAG: VanZ family protein [Lachnospiraceae bacterium]|nr:VanZ family protein [Lachnospiraceae bacterium]